MLVDDILIQKETPRNALVGWAKPNGDNVLLSFNIDGKWRPVGGGSSGNSFNYYTIKEDITYEDLKSLYDSNEDKDNIKVISEEHGIGILSYYHLDKNIDLDIPEADIIKIIWEDLYMEVIGYEENNLLHIIVPPHLRYTVLTTGTSSSLGGNVYVCIVSEIFDSFTGTTLDPYTAHEKTSILFGSDASSLYYLTWASPIPADSLSNNAVVSEWIGTSASGKINLLRVIKQTTSSPGGTEAH